MYQRYIRLCLLYNQSKFAKPCISFLDCYGSSVGYLEAAFRHAPKNAVLCITSTDDAALYGKACDVTLRNYQV